MFLKRCAFWEHPGEKKVKMASVFLKGTNKIPTVHRFFLRLASTAI